MFSIVVLAAGKGSRMRSSLPKMLHPLMGQPLLEYAIEKADDLDPAKFSIVIGHGRDQLLEKFSGRKYGKNREITWAVQQEQLGTAHAAKVGIDSVLAEQEADKSEDVLILNGDLPLLRPETLRAMLESHKNSGADITVLTCNKSDPSGCSARK